MKRCCLTCRTLFRQFFLLLWKNFILQIRRPIGTTFEVILPILAVVFIVGMRLGLFKAEEKCFVTFNSDPLIIPNTSSYYDVSSYNVYYAPNTAEANVLADDYMAPMLNKSGGHLIGVPTQEDFIRALQNESYWYSDCFRGVGIYFESLNSTDVKYSIRFDETFNSWHTDSVSDQFDTGEGANTDNIYLTEGFMHIEKIIDEAIIKWKTGHNVSDHVDVNIRQFPYPHYREDIFLQVVTQFILPLFMILAFIYSAGIFVKELVLEKDTRIKETMKMMGLSNWVLWSSWFGKQVLFYFGPIVIMTILLKYGRVFPLSDGFLIFVYLMLFLFSGIAFCFFVSVWFNSPRIGMMIGWLAWFVTYFPYLFIGPLYSTLNFGTKVGTCMLSNTCAGLGVTVLSTLELRQEGLTFANLARPLSIEDNFHMGWVFFMLIVDTVVYMSLYWYIDAVKPGRYGVPKPLYFLFLPSYWCSWSRSKPLTADELVALSRSTDDQSAHEEEPLDLPVGISIEKLTKVFDRRSLRKRKLAVDQLSLNMYKGQITALLGHNGAGKTTTMSILTGLFPPTEGSAHINGLSVVDDIDLIRYSLGICPQHNVLFDRLTVSEHLSFFARLKGCPNSRVKREVRAMLEDLHLTDKSSTQSKKLSGGMKRKLSVGIALVGGSEVVILDEPTSGMDPFARRATWDLLVKHKEGRTILLTTHFMDEADLLGDRIAIMAEGKLKCSGSSLFLKSRYGVGYHMTVVKEPNCVSANVSSLVESTVTGAVLSTNVGAELSFILPSQSSHLFPELFDKFDEHKESLGISSFGISVTTMEEVFIRVSSGTDNVLLQSTSVYPQPAAALPHTDPDASVQKNETTFSLEKIAEEPQDEVEIHTTTRTNKSKRTKRGSYTHIGQSDDIEGGDYGSINSPVDVPLNTGISLWLQQFSAMFLKRLYHSIRFWLAVIWQLIIPLLFVIFGLILAKVIPKIALSEKNSPSRLLSIQNSAPSENISLFWATIGQSPLSFEAIDESVLGVTNFFNFTDAVLGINDSVQAYSEVGDCCQYQNQILDKFCASRTTTDLRSTCGNSDASFGYKSCLDCLSCCAAPPGTYSCTTSSSYGFQVNCPSPPAVSVADELLGDSGLSGPVDSMNVFVAEQLLRLSRQVKTYNFFLIYQAGYVVHSPEPTYSTCGCQSDEATNCDYMKFALKNYTPDDECTATAVPNCYQLNSSNWEYGFNNQRVSCITRQSCSGYYDSSCDCNDQSCQMGRISQPPPPVTNKPTVTIWYNNQPYHMGAAALNGFYNIYLKSLNSNVTISVTNDPLPKRTEDDNDNNDATAFAFGYIISILAMFGLSFLYSSFIVFPVQERQSKAKHLQFVSGVQASSYWLAAFAWDLLNAFIPALLVIILFAGFQVDGYKDENIGAIFLLMILSCWACIPLNYVLSFVFTNALLAFCLMVVIYFFGPLLIQTAVALVTLSNEHAAEVLNYIFLIHPSFALVSGLNLIYTNQINNEQCHSDPSAPSCHVNSFKFSYPGIGHIMLYMIIDGILFLVLTILIERQFFIPELKQILKHREESAGRGIVNAPYDEDNDVAAERQRVNEMVAHSSQDAVVIKNLVKEYRSAVCPCLLSYRKLAVNGISLIIPAGECFGLLGVNGAGKTTTFKVLTGDITPTAGTAVLSGYDISSQLRLVQQRIGYCPQFDAFIERLTGRELLKLFARLRGVPEGAINETVQSIITRLDLTVHADKRCGAYSGGNKRKLSTAIALVGNPSILMLDEPTTGMDPVTRRFLWDVLISVIREGRSVILTSHSMEECEALCTRLAIMVNGRFKCLGSIQHLKSKFGHGYTLQVRVRPMPIQVEQPMPAGAYVGNPYDTTQVQHFIATTFPGSLLLEQHQGSVTYQIPSEGISWSVLFRTIEQNKDSLNITDYSVSQTTLEQVFINFAQEQYVEL